MSYTEYLRRKAAAAPKVVDTTVRTDASTMTMRIRLAANNEFALSSRQGVINNGADPSNTGTTSNAKAAQMTTKVSGGRIPDASSFTSFVGGQAIDKDGGPFTAPQRYTVAANLPTTLCTNSFINGPAAPKSAGDWVRANAPCTNGREPHNANELGPALFVGDTIAPNRSVGVTTTYVTDTNGTYLGVNRVDNTANTVGDCTRVIHTHPADTPHNTRWAPRPAHGMGGIPVFRVASPGDARKVGAYDYKDRQKFVEKHHGNDQNVNPRRVPTKYVPPRRPPAQLKINDPQHYPVA